MLPFHSRVKAVPTVGGFIPLVTNVWRGGDVFSVSKISQFGDNKEAYQLKLTNTRKLEIRKGKLLKKDEIDYTVYKASTKKCAFYTDLPCNWILAFEEFFQKNPDFDDKWRNLPGSEGLYIKTIIPVLTSEEAEKF